MSSMGKQTQAIKVSSETWRDLNAMKEPGDTFEDVVRRLLESE